MTSLPRWLLTTSGVPGDELFASARGVGSPLIVNTLTDTAYYLKPGVGPTAIAGAPASTAPPEFPVGALYLSTTGVNPATELGYGTWSAFGTGRVLVGVDTGDSDFNTVEETGGSKTQTF